MSYIKQGFTSGQKLMADHLNYMEEGIANAGGVSSWNDLTDKPFGEIVKNDTLVVDWDTFVPEVEAGDSGYVKVSDVTPTLDDFVNGASYVNDSGMVCETSYDEIVSNYNEYGYVYIGNCIVIPYDNFVLGKHPDYTGLTFPEKGFYLYNWAKDRSFTINGFNGFPNTTAVKQIERKYLPEPFVVFRDAYWAAKKVIDGTYKFENTVVVTDNEYYGIQILYPTRYDPNNNDMYTYASCPYYDVNEQKFVIKIQTYQASGTMAGEISEHTVFLSTQN